MQTAFCVLSVLDRLHDGDKRMANAIPHHSVPYQPISAFIKNLFRCFDVISFHPIPCVCCSSLRPQLSNNGRNLHVRESQRADGRYLYTYMLVYYVE